LQAGNAVSFFGYGLILPFEIIYLHQIRRFATATADLVLAAILGTATLVTPPSGTLLDHFRPKPILIAGNLTSALGYAGFAFVDRPWQAFACAVVGGAGGRRGPHREPDAAHHPGNARATCCLVRARARRVQPRPR
jgi:MFS family permease